MTTAVQGTLGQEPGPAAGQRAGGAGQAAGPGAIWEIIHGFTSYWAVVAALDLNLFDVLAERGPRQVPAEELAAAVGAAAPGDLALLADVLVSLGLLTGDGRGYRLTPLSGRFLVSTAETSMAALVRLSPGPVGAWPALARTITAGRPAVTVDDDPAAFYPALSAATAPTQAAVAAGVTARLAELDAWPPAATVVDLGAGSGAWVSTMLALRPDARAVAVDLPGVVEAVTRTARARGVADRLTVVAGDYLAVQLPVQSADVVVLAHVLRAESPRRAARLVARAVRLAGPDGTVVVADYPRPDPPAAPSADRDQVCAAGRHDLLLGLTMLASTAAGRGITVADLRSWAGAAGAEVVDSIEPLPRQRVHLIRSAPRRARGCPSPDGRASPGSGPRGAPPADAPPAGASAGESAGAPAGMPAAPPGRAAA